MCIQRRCQLANTSRSRSRSRNLIPAAAFVRDSHSLLHFFALAQRVSHSEGNTPAGEARRGKAREQTLFLIHTGHYLWQCCAINTTVEPIKRTARSTALLSSIFFFFFHLFVDDMRSVRSRATTHVPINEAQRGEEPERIGGLVFEREGGGAKERKRRS